MSEINESAFPKSEKAGSEFEKTDDSTVVAVTGATGLVGRAVVERLLRSEKYKVVALGRRADALAALAAECHAACGNSENLTLRECDVNDSAALDAALSGATVVVHAAGSVDNLADRAAVFKVNVDGTRAVLAAAQKQNLKQFIHISSLSTITGQADQYDVDESAPLVTCGEPYADSKVEAEKCLAAARTAGSLPITILRPGFIYGPGERAWMPRVIDNIRHGRAVLVDGGSRQTNVIFVGNLAMAIEGAILNSRAYGEVFNLTDGERVTKKLLFDEIAEGLALPPVKRDLPRQTIKPVFEIMAAITPFLPKKMRPGLARFSPGAFRLVAVNQGFSIGKAEQLLDYRNRIPFRDGMAMTLAGFKKNGV
ncbi:MAG: SDR family NAD(P)-dependent oxidoreductase [Cyanobacteria bacterium REEB67]|nr:SDR family NAD(P)-dependent oxidoreductase [Cyanobacteria bacterium REEB67]